MICRYHGRILLMSNELEAILLAAGNGTRLKPFTHYTSKHLLPVGEIPMIFYPLKNLQLIGVKKVYLIINEKHFSQWENLIDKYDFQMSIEIVFQSDPLGIPDAIKCCEDKIHGNNFIVALGDNIILASNFITRLRDLILNSNKTIICGYPVENPSAFGVASFNSKGVLDRIYEKPVNPPSNIAIIGLYKFSRDVFKYIDDLKLSDRNEFEIVDVINKYLSLDKCELLRLESSTDFWLDTGTNESLFNASQFIKQLSKSSNIKIAQFDEINT
jgi:glucose-1-phosphate thymidylyltransferase